MFGQGHAPAQSPWVLSDGGEPDATSVSGGSWNTDAIFAGA
jgi:hypothetical protein